MREGIWQHFTVSWHRNNWISFYGWHKRCIYAFIEKKYFYLFIFQFAKQTSCMVFHAKAEKVILPAGIDIMSPLTETKNKRKEKK